MGEAWGEYLVRRIVPLAFLCWGWPTFDLTIAQAPLGFSGQTLYPLHALIPKSVNVAPSPHRTFAARAVD